MVAMFAKMKHNNPIQIKLSMLMPYDRDTKLYPPPNIKPGTPTGMTRSIARELGGYNITVNAIAQGFTLTDASLNMMEDAANYEVNEPRRA